MRGRAGSGWIVVFSVVASLVVHFAVGVAWTRLADSSGFSLSMEDDEPRPRRVRPGVADSRAVTMTWIGFASPSEHHAPQSRIEQPALSPDAAQARAEQESWAPGDWSDLVVPDISAAPMRSALRALVQASQEAMAAQARRESRAVPSEATAGPQEHPEAIASESESDPVAYRRPIKVSPGKTVAAEGLTITTERPRWTTLTRAISDPGNPCVAVTFGPDGAVRYARFTVDDEGDVQNTGSRDVDEPLINAIYRWKAEGEAIDALDENDPEAGVTIEFVILLQ